MISAIFIREALLANVAKNPSIFQFAIAQADSGEVWLQERGCRISVRSGAVVSCSLLEGGPIFNEESEASPELKKALTQVGEYLQGKRRHFELDLFMEGPPFYRKVWEALCRVPYGKTLSYAELALLAGSPGSARAVGSAMRRNPLVILVPCHRVVGSQGRLGGYSYGSSWKRYLLDLENRSENLEFRA